MGLLPNVPQPGGTPAAATAQGDERYIPDGESNVAPEEQAEYDQFVKNGMAMLYHQGEVSPAIIESLSAKGEGSEGEGEGKGPSGPVIALANTTVEIVSHLDESSRQAGKPVSNDVLLHGGIEIMEQLIDIAETANVHDYSEEEQQGAIAIAMDMYRPKLIEGGRTSEDALKGEFGEVVQADEQGQMEEMLPGIDKVTKRGQAE
jgi:hypothetical protein